MSQSEQQTLKLIRIWQKYYHKKFYSTGLQGLKTCGLYYKHMMIVNYASSIVNKLKALHNDDARVVIYDRHVFIVQATGLNNLLW